MNLEYISNQKPFLQKIRAALGQPVGHARKFHDLFSGHGIESSLLINKIKSRSAKDRKRLLDRLIHEGGFLNLKVIPVPTAADAARAITELALDRTPEWSDARSLVTWRHPLIDGLNLPERLKNQGIPVYAPDPEPANAGLFRLRAQTALIGVTSADYCIAESASLVLKTRPGQPRMVSLLPSIHVAVITEDQMLESLAECYVLVKQDPDAEKEGMTCCMTLISGPSKTADIEAVMVHGAHGPREMIIYVLAS
ncbi:MAG: lactate utilization protein [Deltaproteobacteria bacterium]|nr:lactate utilization protein [Deltaproteobacteria bacterium]